MTQTDYIPVLVGTPEQLKAFNKLDLKDRKLYCYELLTELEIATHGVRKSDFWHAFYRVDRATGKATQG